MKGRRLDVEALNGVQVHLPQEFISIGCVQGPTPKRGRWSYSSDSRWKPEITQKKSPSSLRAIFFECGYLGKTSLAFPLCLLGLDKGNMDAYIPSVLQTALYKGGKVRPM